MRLEELYNLINKQEVTSDLIIFKNADSSFLSNQYINEIAKQHGLLKHIYNTLEEVPVIESSFSSFMTPELGILHIDKFDCADASLLKKHNLIITCTSITKSTETLFKRYIVNIPKLEPWQIKDFMYSQLQGISQADIDWLYNICSGNMDRIAVEVDRLKIFSDVERSVILKQFIEDSIYDDLSLNTVFEFTNAITTKDIEKIKFIYKDLNKFDSNPIGIWSILYNNFKNIILVQCTNVKSPEVCGLKPGVFWAIKNNMNHYTREELYNIFLKLSDIDRKIKIGDVEIDTLLDYVILDILN